MLTVPAACQTRTPAPTDAGPSEPSPAASLLPAPLASGLELGLHDGGAHDAEPDAAPPAPEWAREDRGLPSDAHELLDPSLLALASRFRWADVALPPRLPEADAEALERARERATFDLAIELGVAGRMRVVFASPHFVVPEGTELRARTDFLGHALVWPGQARYAIIQAGALRAVLNERRADVQPLTLAKPATIGAGKLLGFATEKSRFTTPFGKLDLEQARVPGSGGGGALLCRMLVEVAGLDPEAVACASDLVPVRAEYTWLSGGRFLFETSSIARGSAAGTDVLRVPPIGAEHRVGELPEPASPHLVERGELRAFRKKPLPPPEPRDAAAPKEGLLAVNGGDFLSYLIVDAVPVVRLRPRGGEVLIDLVPGTYSVAARDFLGDEVHPPAVVTVPARVVVNEGPKPEEQ